MRVERPVPADPALEPEGVRIGRQQQLDRRGIEADAVVEPIDLVLGIDALDGHHRHQHLDLGDLGRIAGEQRLDVVRGRADDHEIDPVARDIDPRQRLAQLVDLGNHDAALEGGRLDDHRRVLGIGAGIKVAGGIGGLGRHQADARRQIDEVAAEQFQIGVDRADRDAAGARQIGEPARLRPRE